jgi:hypothetical protein
MDINQNVNKEQNRMITVSLFQNRGKVIFVGAVATILLVIVGLTSVNLAEARGAASCDGTYLVEYSEIKNLWTFSMDGTIQVTDSQELDINLSHAQGAWQRAGAREVKAMWLAFLNFSGPGYGRVDADITFENGCDTIKGTFDARTYTIDQDPLDPTGGTPVVENISFTGQRLNP